LAGSGGATAVPEPAATSLIMLTTISAIFRRRARP
jgi:hypothetical protein